MADTITEPAVPSTPAKPDVLPFVEPAAATEEKEPNNENDTLENETSTATSVPAPAPVNAGAHGADSSVAPASSATDNSGAVLALTTKEEGSNKVPATVEAAQEREGTPSADTKAQAIKPSIEPQPVKATAGIDSTMTEATKESEAPAVPVTEEAIAPKDTSGDVKTSDDEDKHADGASTKGESTAEEIIPGVVDAPAAAADDESTTPAKTSKTPTTLARRKSVGQKLNRKGSKARMVHLDAKPGEHYFVKLKGYPAWPVVICDEEMLPETLLKSRPVTAARPDGTYREDYADGGRRATDRTFPVLYLYTYEFGWVPNQDMSDLNPEKAVDMINDKMRKDLQQAHYLAAENNSLEFYKELLRQFQEDKEQAEEAKRQAAEAKRMAQATPKKSKKTATDEDVDMMDVPDDENATASTKSKKRKAEEDVRTPQLTDSVKKPKIKITSSGTPKNNGTPSSAAKNKTSKSSADSKAKHASKAPASNKTDSAAPAEPELDSEEKRRRKAKEVLFFLRHKIQKGLLARDQAPKESEMKTVSDYLTKLEGLADLELSAIRETKMNKVLKAILKIETIPREDEFKFKPRSQTLLEKWNKLLVPTPVVDAGAPAANGASTTNGEAKSKGLEKNVEEAEKTVKGEETMEVKKSEEADKTAEAEEPVEAEKPAENAGPEPAAASGELKADENVATA